MISVFLLVLIIKFVFEEVLKKFSRCALKVTTGNFFLMTFLCGGGGVRTHFIDCSYASYSWVL